MSEEVSQEEAQQFDYIRHLHWFMAGYVRIKTWEDLMRFENHVDVKLADCGFMTTEEARRIHLKYHHLEYERLVKEFQ